MDQSIKKAHHQITLKESHIVIFGANTASYKEPLLCFCASWHISSALLPYFVEMFVKATWQSFAPKIWRNVTTFCPKVTILFGARGWQWDPEHAGLDNNAGVVRIFLRREGGASPNYDRPATDHKKLKGHIIASRNFGLDQFKREGPS